MILEKLNKELEILDEACRKEKERLIHKYAMDNNPYVIGEVVTDHIGTICIEHIQGTSSFPSGYECRYHGPELTKKGVPKKNGERRFVFQSNIVRKGS